MAEFRQYRRTGIAEMRRVEPGETATALQARGVSISETDLDAGSPKPGDMIARNPDNHADQWLVSAGYFAGNFEPVPTPGSREATTDAALERIENAVRQLDEMLMQRPPAATTQEAPDAEE